jgi:SHS2 domain-containing protein
MASSRFIEIDHSGDVGIEAWGETPAALFENVTAGLLGLMSSGPHEAEVARELSASAARSDDLLVDWLGQVILAAATHGEVYSNVRLDAVEAHGARGVVRGARVGSSRRAWRFDVKAATYHRLQVEAGADGRYHAFVVFDL